jgi:predicted nucleotidyltransferase
MGQIQRDEIMTTTEAQATIQEMVRRIVEKFDPVQVILFGSYARGTAGPDSDVDLLVVMPFTGRHVDKCVEIRIELRGMGLAKDVFVITPEEAMNYRDVIGTIIYPAFHEGKILYERSA